MNDNQTSVGDQSLSSMDPPPITVGRYVLHRQIARGGMATIHIARLMGDEGFSRIVAAKRLLPEFAEDSEFVAMFLDEARIASKVHHRNVVPVLDVVTTGEEAILVQEYVHGAPLHWLLRTARSAKQHIPLPIAVSIATQILAGLHAAHETSDELGVPLNIVHRDVSPQNIMIATDGSARLLDFGVAKATMAAHVTREGQFKGKLAYSAPEQLRGHATRQSDLYSLAVLLWELIVGHRMHQSAQAEVELVATIMNGKLPTVTEALGGERHTIGSDRWHDLEAIEPIVKTGLAVDLKDRWATASDMEHALIDAVRPASLGEVSTWLKNLGREFLDKHDRVLAAEEASWRRTGNPQMSRMTPFPGSLPAVGRTGSRQSVVSQLSTTAQGNGQAFPTEPPRRLGSNALIALLCSLVVALAIGVVVAVRGPAGKTASALEPAAAPPAPTATTPAPTTPPPPPPLPSTGTATVAPTTPPPPSQAKTVEPKPEPIELQLATPPAPKAAVKEVRKDPPAPPRRVQQPPPRAQPQAQKASKQPDKEKVETPAKPADAKDAKDDCNPPYYFEGQKKIFKPACI